MTDITDRTAGIGEAWERGVAGPIAEFLTVFARGIAARPDVYSDDLVNSARAVLATVDAPASTLAAELADIAENWEEWATDTITAALTDATTRAEKMERDLTEARAEVERVTSERDAARDNEAGDSMRQQAEAWSKVWNHPVMRAALPGGGSALSRALGVLDSLHAAQKAAESSAESNAETPDPADVPAGEAWLVECRGERRTAVKDNDDTVPWCTVSADGWHMSKRNESVTLVSRLAPAPRVITNPDELDALAEGSIVRDNEGDPATRRAGGLDYRGVEGVCNDVHHYLPVTVLWEPGA